MRCSHRCFVGHLHTEENSLYCVLERKLEVRQCDEILRHLVTFKLHGLNV